MAITLRPHQVLAYQEVDRLHSSGHKNVCCVLPTGAGKSLTLAHFAQRALHNNEPCIVFAHRDVLISQLSEALCKMGVSHSFICSDKARRDITNNNVALFGDSFHNETSPVIVSSTPTFNARLKAGKIPTNFLLSVKWWLQDETHHLVNDTSWFNCITGMIYAKRDRVHSNANTGRQKGLGSHADGVFNALSVTTSMFDLIKKGMLTPYKIYSTGHFDPKSCEVTSGGDYNQRKLVLGINKREITGDAVQHYLRLTPNKPVITFCVNIEHAKDVAKQFNEAGVPSVAISSKSELKDRKKAMDDFRAGRIMNLVNVDLLGEGYDCPAVTVVIMLRPTQSYSLFKQQFGRMLRPDEGKSHGILLDHVGNTQYFMQRFNLSAPHDDPVWTLDRGELRKKQESLEENELIETMTCADCGCMGAVKPANYVRQPDDIGQLFIDRKCPDCGHVETEAEQEKRIRELKVTKGELVELSFDVVEAIIKQRNDSLKPVAEFAKTVANSTFASAAKENFANKQHALSILMHWIQAWCTEQWKLTGQSVALVQLDFELVFKVNILKAQVMSGPQMNELAARIQHEFYKMRKAG